MWYRYEMHLHTNLCSACARSTPEEMVEAYHRAGYAGLVVTDHFYFGNTCVPRSWPWERFVRQYDEAYRRAKTAGERYGMDVLFGLEHHYGSGKELLVYGIDLAFLLANPDLVRVPVDAFVDRVHRAGGYIAMAHPYRDRDYIDRTVKPRPELLDGAEVYNYFNTPAENARAETLAREFGLGRLSGADVHDACSDSIGQAGLAFPCRVADNRALAKALFAGTGRLIIDGRIEGEA